MMAIDETKAENVLLMLRGVIAAMAMGVATFAGISLYLVQTGTMGNQPDLGKILLLVLAAMAIAELPAYFVIRRVLVGQLRGQLEAAGASERDQLIGQGFSSTVIIGAAMAEGLGLLGVLTYLLSGQWVALVAPVLTLIVLISLFPSRWKLDNFAEEVTRKEVM